MSALIDHSTRPSPSAPSDPIVSVIVPIHESEPYVARCLESVLAQGLSDSDLEVIVVDDGSTDGGPAVAERFADAHPNVVVSRQPNKGVSGARNHGLERARGSYVAFVDSDDYLAPGALGELATLAIREGLDAVAFDYARPDEGEEVPDPPTIIPDGTYVTTGVDYFAEHPYNTPVWAYLWRRDLLVDTGLRFDEGRILEDLVFTTTALAAADRVADVPTDLYRYVRRPGSILTTRSREDTLRFAQDGERAIAGMDDLRRSISGRGSTPPRFDEGLLASEQRVLFLIIGRFVRSDVPLRPALMRLLRRFRRRGIYPMDRFPTGEHRNLRTMLLTAIFNRPTLLVAFAAIVRTADRVAASLRRSARARSARPT